MKKCLTCIALALVAALLPGSLGAVAPDSRDTPTLSGVASGISAVRSDSTPSAGATDADGLRPLARSVTLHDLTDPVSVPDAHGHVESASRGITIELPEQPEMAILDDVAVESEFAVRSHDGAAWSDWVTLVATEDEAPDGAVGGEGEPPDGITGIGPIWLGTGAERLQVVGISGDPTLVIRTLEVLDTPAVGDDPRGVRAAPAAASSSFIRPRTDWATSGMGWGGGNSGCGSAPKISRVTGMVVHHTAGTNGYSSADVPGIMRGIWYFHVQTRGWCDVAYNFFVDRFGQAWEGRQGGVSKAVIGGHTYGFNTYTSGVAQLGNFDSVTASSAMTTATAHLVGWKLSLHGVDPSGKTTYINSASSPASDGTPAGGTKTLSSVVGHRNLGSTSCPGSSTYAQLPRIRTIARTGAHVRALFTAFIGRSPSANEFASWARLAQSSGLGAVAERLSESPEYAGVVVDELYEVVLDRRPDSSGRSYWLGQLRSGMTVAEMSVYFFGSEEYYRKTGGRGGFVDALYRDLLHRTADASGRAYWVYQIDRGVTPTVVVKSFFDSIESRRDRVTRLYGRFLGRRPDPGGLAYWADVLATSDDLTLATHLALSEEFYRRNH